VGTHYKHLNYNHMAGVDHQESILSPERVYPAPFWQDYSIFSGMGGLSWQSIYSEKGGIELSGGLSPHVLTTHYWLDDIFYRHRLRQNNQTITLIQHRISQLDPAWMMTWFSAGAWLRSGENNAVRLSAIAELGFKPFVRGDFTYFPDTGPSRSGSFQTRGNSLQMQVSYLFSVPAKPVRKAKPPVNTQWSVGLDAGLFFQRYRVTPEPSLMRSIWAPHYGAKLHAAYHLPSGWVLEGGLHVQGHTPSVGYVFEDELEASGSGSGIPITGGFAGAAYKLVNKPRFRVYGRGSVGLAFTPYDPDMIGITWVGPIESDDSYLFIRYEERQFRPAVPFLSVGLRSEWRISHGGPAWLYAHLGSTAGWRDLAGLDITYWTEPSHSQPNEAISRYAGTGWELSFGTRVFFGK
jgi:hypothetical protein